MFESRRLLLKVVLLTGCTVVGCNSGNSSTVPTAGLPGSAKPGDAMTGRPAVPGTGDENVVVVDLKDLQLKFDLESKYGSQTIETSGAIDSLLPLEEGGTSILLKAGEGLADLVACPTAEASAWSRLGPGQSVTLQGKAGGNLGGFNWSVVKAGPNPCPVITSREFAAEFDRDPETARTKYDGQYFYVTGKVVEAPQEGGESTGYILEGSKRWPVKLTSPDLLSDYKWPVVETGRDFTAHCQFKPLLWDEWSLPEELELQGLAVTAPFPAAGVTYGKPLPSLIEKDAKVAAQMKETPADIRAEATALLKELKDDRHAFYEKYKRKVAELTGPIVAFHTYNGRDKIRLGGLDLNCTLSERSPWKTLVPGQHVTIRGRFDNIAIDVEFLSCVVVKAEPPQTAIRQLTAADLLQMCRAAGDNFDKDWKGTVVKVTGKLVASEIEQFGSTVELEGEDGKSVKILLASASHAKRIKFADREPGDSVSLLAQIDFLYDDGLQLRGGWILTNASE